MEWLRQHPSAGETTRRIGSGDFEFSESSGGGMRQTRTLANLLA